MKKHLRWPNSKILKIDLFNPTGSVEISDFHTFLNEDICSVCDSRYGYLFVLISSSKKIILSKFFIQKDLETLLDNLYQCFYETVTDIHNCDLYNGKRAEQDIFHEMKLNYYRNE